MAASRLFCFPEWDPEATTEKGSRHPPLLGTKIAPVTGKKPRTIHRLCAACSQLTFAVFPRLIHSSLVDHSLLTATHARQLPSFSHLIAPNPLLSLSFQPLCRIKSSLGRLSRLTLVIDNCHPKRTFSVFVSQQQLFREPVKTHSGDRQLCS